MNTLKDLKHYLNLGLKRATYLYRHQYLKTLIDFNLHLRNMVIGQTKLSLTVPQARDDLIVIPIYKIIEEYSYILIKKLKESDLIG